MRLNAMPRVVMGAVCCAWLCLPAVANAQPASTTASATTASSGEQNLFGFRSHPIVGTEMCGPCHKSGGAGGVLGGGVGWIKQDETKIFVDHDQHLHSYAVLLLKPSEDIARRMGIVDPSGAPAAHRDPRCLSCHSGVPAPQMMAEAKRETTSDCWLVPETSKNSLYLYGVGCEGCHGPAGKSEDSAGYAFAHQNPASWRYLPAADKYERFGYWDVRTPVVKTRICLSCHIGNVEQGKVITHEMYAAGHPPLPAFELSTFTAQEPRHWQTFGEKTPEVRQQFLEQTGGQFDPAALEQTRDSLVAALVSLSESLKLSADLAEGGRDATGADLQWPELANFSCFACHHELKSESWRQQRTQRLILGRPALHEWTLILAEIAAESAGSSSDQLDAQLGGLRAALNDRPFGEPTALRKAIQPAVEEIDALAWQLSGKNLDVADGRAILLRICDRGSSESLSYDYDSARQLVWAFDRIYAEIRSKENGEVPMPGDERQETRLWNGWYRDHTNLDGVQQELADLSPNLMLDLMDDSSRWRSDKLMPITLPGAEQPGNLSAVDLSKSLPKIDVYAPETVRETFVRLRSKINPPH